ncbi:MAG: hypothetical protein WCG27_09415 [Pseudomonadota bacterium]
MGAWAQTTAQIPLSKILSELAGDLKEDFSWGEECQKRFDFYYQRLANFTPKEIVNENNHEVIKQTFQLRISIYQVIRDHQQALDQNETCVNSIRSVTRSLRYLEDYLIQQSLEKSPIRELEGEWPYLQVNPDFPDFKGKEQLLSGDILLTQGNDFFSSAVTRLASVATQFGHSSFLYKDANGGLFTVEALKNGTAVRPFKEHQDGGNSRAIVLRHRDPQKAKEAVTALVNYLENFRQQNGYDVPYDFKFELEDHRRLFCTEAIRLGFDLAGIKDNPLPRYKSHFTVGMVNFLHSFGIPVDQSNAANYPVFAPGDLEFDPQFDIVAEWRDPAQLSSAMMRDMVTSKTFQWMGEKNYVYYRPADIWIKSNLAWAARHMCCTRRYFSQEIPYNMGIQQMKIYLMMEKVGKILFNYLENLQEKNQLLLSYNQMLTELEKLRENDYKKWIHYQSLRKEILKKEQEKNHNYKTIMAKDIPYFHQWLHPSDPLDL